MNARTLTRATAVGTAAFVALLPAAGQLVGQWPMGGGDARHTGQAEVQASRFVAHDDDGGIILVTTGGADGGEVKCYWGT